MFHKWYNDPYAKGNWGLAPPGFITAYTHALQEKSGNIHWASAGSQSQNINA